MIRFAGILVAAALARVSSASVDPVDDYVRPPLAPRRFRRYRAPTPNGPKYFTLRSSAEGRPPGVLVED